MAGSNLLWARSAARRARGFGGAAESTELETTLIVKKMKKCVGKNGGTRKNRSLVWGTDGLYARENVEKTDDPRDEMAPRYVHVRAEKRRQELKIRRDTEFRGRVVGLSRVSLGGYVEFWWYGAVDSTVYNGDFAEDEDDQGFNLFYSIISMFSDGAKTIDGVA